ncbi:MAG: hypothetical protein QOJ59_2512, partial [Thermomicrobiales bacterium]|nr:hypothetical protein [Thermomicrobiales bacterium]
MQRDPLIAAFDVRYRSATQADLLSKFSMRESSGI